MRRCVVQMSSSARSVVQRSTLSYSFQPNLAKYHHMETVYEVLPWRSE